MLSAGSEIIRDKFFRSVHGLTVPGRSSGFVVPFILFFIAHFDKEKSNRDAISSMANGILPGF